jgi:hypothetical protein
VLAQAALAAHIRAGNALRKHKAAHGRGRRGLARADRAAQRERRDVMQALNS